MSSASTNGHTTGLWPHVTPSHPCKKCKKPDWCRASTDGDWAACKRVSEGAHKTAHYAICTGFMALGMMLPGMPSGWIQSQLGYSRFFIWVLIACIPSLIVTAFLPLECLQRNEWCQPKALGG